MVLSRLRGLRLPRADWPLVAGGALLTFASYPPLHLVIPSFLCLVPAVWLIQAAATDGRPLRRSLVQGFWFGLLSHGLVLYWMVAALWHFTSLSALGYLATVAVLALLTSVTFATVGWIARTTGASLVWVLPMGWTALEWWIGHQGDIRFPWLGLGSSLTGHPLLIQVADLVGARGVTFLLAAANVALALAWARRANRWEAARLAGAVALGVIAAAAYGAYRGLTLPTAPVGRVTVIQPSEYEKWDNSRARQDSIFAHLLGLSQQALAAGRTDLLAWPEAAVPNYFVSRPDFEAGIGHLAAAAGVPVLVGGLDVEFYPDGTNDPYNAAFLFDADGRRDRQPVYRKRELVPIVERVPFVDPRWFRALRFFGAFGRGGPGPVFEVNAGRFGVLICYESAFEYLARDYRRRGADFLVNITNDAWFGRSAAPHQHAAHLVMRAIENRVSIARAANNGISGFVDPLGGVHAATALDDTTFAVGTVFTTPGRSVYNRLGDWVGLLAIGGTLLMAGLAWRAGRMGRTGR